MDLLPAHEPQWSTLPEHGFGRCACHPSRRLFTGLLMGGLAAPAWAREGVEVREESWAVKQLMKIYSADRVEQVGAQQYAQMKREAQQQRALVSAEHTQVKRLNYIGQRLLPFAADWNPRARQWRWEVNLIASEQLNAFCMPGGKIAFFSGILVRLGLDDDEVAAIMGHEIAHALREHARERMAKSQGTELVLRGGAALLGLGNAGDLAAGIGSQLLSLQYSRSDETEADLVGIELAARAGYDPAAAVQVWQKMGAQNKGAPPQFLSTHPSGPTRIRDIEGNLEKVAGLYAKAAKPPQRFPVAQAKG